MLDIHPYGLNRKDIIRNKLIRGSVGVAYIVDTTRVNNL